MTFLHLELRDIYLKNELFDGGVGCMDASSVTVNGSMPK